MSWSGVQRQALEDLVDGVLRPVGRQSHQRHPVSGHRADGRPVVLVVAGLEHVLVYHRHSHETYSFGVTEDGAQSFTCRGSAHTSAAGMVMAFNPDDPHDGHASDELGFTYRMVHIGPELVSSVLAGITGRPAGLPLFTDPVVSDPVDRK